MKTTKRSVISKIDELQSKAQQKTIERTRQTSLRLSLSLFSRLIQAEMEIEMQFVVPRNCRGVYLRLAQLHTRHFPSCKPSRDYANSAYHLFFVSTPIYIYPVAQLGREDPSSPLLWANETATPICILRACRYVYVYRCSRVSGQLWSAASFWCVHQLFRSESFLWPRLTCKIVNHVLGEGMKANWRIPSDHCLAMRLGLHFQDLGVYPSTI